MILKTKIRPSIITGHTKESVISKFRSTCATFSSLYGFYLKEDDENVFVYNLQKFRRKTSQKKGLKAGKLVTKSTVLIQAHWVMYVYRIPKSWLSTNHKKVDQKTRNFIILDNK